MLEIGKKGNSILYSKKGQKNNHFSRFSPTSLQPKIKIKINEKIGSTCVCAPPFGESEHVQHVYVHTNTNTNTKQCGYRCGLQWRRRIKDSLFFPSRIRSYQQVLLCSSNYTITLSRKYTCQGHVMIAFMHGPV